MVLSNSISLGTRPCSAFSLPNTFVALRVKFTLVISLNAGAAKKRSVPPAKMAISTRATFLFMLTNPTHKITSAMSQADAHANLHTPTWLLQRSSALQEGTVPLRGTANPMMALF